MPRIIAKKPETLSRKDLEQFVEKVRDELFVSQDKDGDDVWDLEKQMDGDDFVQFVLDRLNELGLYPEEEQPCQP